MHFLFITRGGLLSAAKRVSLEGNSVSVFNPEGGANGDGYVHVVDTLDLKPDSVVVFDAPGYGKLAESLRREGWPVVGGSLLGDAIDKNYVQNLALLRLSSIEHPVSRVVETYDEAESMIRTHSIMNTILVPSNRRVPAGMTESGPFVVTESITEPEAYFGGWFNGTDWIFGGFFSSLNERSFLTGGLGSDVGSAGAITFFYKHARPALVKKSLIKLSRFLTQQAYRGPVGVYMRGSNTTAIRFGFESGIWPGLMRLIGGDLGRFFADLARGQTRKIRASVQYVASLLLSVPPFPHSDGGGPVPDVAVTVPVDLLMNFHLEHGRLVDGRFFVGPKIGYVTHVAPSVSGLKGLYEQVATLHIPNIQYRTDLVSNHSIGRVRELLRRVSVEGSLPLPIEPLTGRQLMNESQVGG